MPKVKHWLHDDCEFVVIVEEETRCRWCTHSRVCSQDMAQLCVNMDMKSSGDFTTCECCLHKYTRHDNKQSIPCFLCKLFASREPFRSQGPWREIWSRPKPAEARWWRRGIAVIEDRRRVYEAIIDAPDDTLGGPDSELEFVPLSKIEFEAMRQHIAEDEDNMLVDYSSKRRG